MTTPEKISSLAAKSHDIDLLLGVLANKHLGSFDQVRIERAAQTLVRGDYYK